VKEKNAKLYGYPALNYNDYLKSYAYFKRLPDIVEKLRQLEIDIQKIKENE
jgi:UDP-3-O-[3-hydroxymyristoyl] glucosamine N-acyltransferase